MARSWMVITDGQRRLPRGSAPAGPKYAFGLRRRIMAGHCRWRPSSRVVGNRRYVVFGTCMNAPRGPNTVSLQSGRSTAMEWRICVV